MIDYTGHLKGQSMFEEWERGELGLMPPPLATWSVEYREMLVTLVETLKTPNRATMLSLGSGNGFAEALFASRGIDVLATDANPIAVRLCSEKGLRSRLLDVTSVSDQGIGRFDIVYADGLLGHLAAWPERHNRFWTIVNAASGPGGFVLLSNDLADSDLKATTGVTHDAEAVFFRPPAGWYVTAASKRGWQALRSEVYVYTRPERGLRRREILVLNRTTDG